MQGMIEPAKLRSLIIGIVLYALLLVSIGLIGIGIVGLMSDSIAGVIPLSVGIALLLIVSSIYYKLYRRWRKSVRA